MMIKVLDKETAAKIAAGEVIEAPVSIVKELVENSIDAGASTITVEIKNGGIDYIRVSDNGTGIDPLEVETAFLRHATSKLRHAADLHNIVTLGFRGEALASIAAVSKVEIITTTATASHGRRLLIHGSNVIENKPIGSPIGTTIIIRDLFYNTPARLKFLKKPASEAISISTFMSEIALAYPAIKFMYIKNGNEVFATSGKGRLIDVIGTCFPRTNLDALVPFSAGDGQELQLWGYVSRVSTSRSNRRGQLFFVNGRLIDSKLLEAAIDEAYRERLFEGRFPEAYIFVKENPLYLDVNIHPNKRQVKFLKEEAIKTLLVSAISEALGKEEFLAAGIDSFTEKKSLGLGDSIINTKTKESKDYIADKKEYNIGTNTYHNASLFQEEKDYQQMDLRSFLKDRGKQHNELEASSESDQKNKIEIYDSMDADIFSAYEVSGKPFEIGQLSVVGSIFDTYILAKNEEESFFMIDQHAAHERIFYERLVGHYLDSKPSSQLLLLPFSVVVDEKLIDVTTFSTCLNKMGYKLDQSGPSQYRVREIPSFMTISEAELFLKTFIDEAESNNFIENKIVIDKLITTSCKSAIKAHDKLSTEEIDALLRDLSTCRNPFSCPHGRPTIIRFTKYHIERLFKRS